MKGSFLNKQVHAQDLEGCLSGRFLISGFSGLPASLRFCYNWRSELPWKTWVLVEAGLESCSRCPFALVRDLTPVDLDELAVFVFCVVWVCSPFLHEAQELRWPSL